MGNKIPTLSGLNCRFFIFGVIWLGAIATAHAGADALSRIVTPGAKPSYVERHHLLHAMDNAALSGGAPVLIDFMERGEVPEGMRKDEYFSLANDIYDKLLAESIAPAQLLAHLLKVVPDEEREKVWRDYCAQKLPATLLHPAITNEGVWNGLELLERLMKGEFPQMQGTAFIGACQLEPAGLKVRHDSMRPGFIGGQALRCASDEKSPLPDRVTALQVAGRYLPEKSLVYASSLLSSDQPEVAAMLKVSAIATLGQIGNESHLPLLQSFRLSYDLRLRKAARVAIERLKS